MTAGAAAADRRLADLIPPIGGTASASAGAPLEGELILPVRPRSAGTRAAPRPVAATAFALVEAVEPEVDEESVEERIAAAEARGRAEGERAAQERHARALAEAEARHAARLESARAEWARAEGERLAARLVDGLAGLEDRLATAAARALAPVLDEAGRQRALAALAGTVREILERPDPPLLAATGPADLLEAFLAAAGPAGASVSVEPSSEETEVRLVADYTVFETRLSDWARRVGAALGEPEEAGSALAPGATDAAAQPGPDVASSASAGASVPPEGTDAAPTATAPGAPVAGEGYGEAGGVHG